jgi:hypothetical protein
MRPSAEIQTDPNLQPGKTSMVPPLRQISSPYTAQFAAPPFIGTS